MESPQAAASISMACCTGRAKPSVRFVACFGGSGKSVECPAATVLVCLAGRARWHPFRSLRCWEWRVESSWQFCGLPCSPYRTFFVASDASDVAQDSPREASACCHTPGRGEADPQRHGLRFAEKVTALMSLVKGSAAQCWTPVSSRSRRVCLATFAGSGFLATVCEMLFSSTYPLCSSSCLLPF